MSFRTKKKTTKMDGPETNLGPIPLTPSSAPGADDSPREGIEVRLEPQHEPRSPSVRPKEKIREHTQKLKKKRRAGLTETSFLNSTISTSSSYSSTNSNSPRSAEVPTWTPASGTSGGGGGREFEPPPEPW